VTLDEKLRELDSDLRELIDNPRANPSVLEAKYKPEALLYLIQVARVAREYAAANTAEGANDATEDLIEALDALRSALGVGDGE
jgi:hypothetical protein